MVVRSETVASGGGGAVRGSVLEDFGEGFQGEHVEVEECGCLLVDGFLEAALGIGGSGEVSDTAGGDVVLSKGFHEALADLGGFGELGGGGRSVRISGILC